MKLLGIISVVFNTNDQLLITFSTFLTYWRTKWEYSETVQLLYINFRKAYDSVRSKVLYNILIEFGIHMKLVRLIKMYLNEMYSKVCIGKHLSNSFPIQNSKTWRLFIVTAF
jgi:hypothetical protein